VEDEDDRTVFTTYGVGAAGNDRDVRQLVAINALNINETIRGSGNDTTIRASQATISASIN